MKNSHHGRKDERSDEQKNKTDGIDAGEECRLYFPFTDRLKKMDRMTDRMSVGDRIYRPFTDRMAVMDIARDNMTKCLETPKITKKQERERRRWCLATEEVERKTASLMAFTP